MSLRSRSMVFALAAGCLAGAPTSAEVERPAWLRIEVTPAFLPVPAPVMSDVVTLRHESV